MLSIVFWNCFDLASTCVSINIGTFSFACLLPLNLLKHWNDSDALSSYISRFWYLLIIIHFLILVSVYSAAASTLCKLSPFLICLPPPFKGFCLKTKIKNKQIIQIWPPLFIFIRKEEENIKKQTNTDRQSDLSAVFGPNIWIPSFTASITAGDLSRRKILI